METLDRITLDLARLGGEPCIRSLRLTVRRALEPLPTYPDGAKIKREYPNSRTKAFGKRSPSLPSRFSGEMET